MNHDEFLRRALALQSIKRGNSIEREGLRYLARVSKVDEAIRARSIASYEDGGLSRVFAAMLRAPLWQGAGALAFKHFLECHIQFDTGETHSHGALSRHLAVDDSILPLWMAFAELLRSAVPFFARGAHVTTKTARLKKAFPSALGLAAKAQVAASSTAASASPNSATGE